MVNSVTTKIATIFVLSQFQVCNLNNDPIKSDKTCRGWSKTLLYYNGQTPLVQSKEFLARYKTYNKGTGNQIEQADLNSI